MPTAIPRLLGMFILIIPNTGEATIAPPSFVDTLTWLLVNMVTGWLNTLILYWLAHTRDRNNHDSACRVDEFAAPCPRTLAD